MRALFESTIWLALLAAVPAAECVAGQGLRGDRFFGYKSNYKGQLTLFSLEVWQQLQRELGCWDIDPSATRRNLLVSGVDLRTLIGRRFTLQEGECMGACGDAPVMLLNNRRMCSSMRPEQIDELLAELK